MLSIQRVSTVLKFSEPWELDILLRIAFMPVVLVVISVLQDAIPSEPEI